MIKQLSRFVVEVSPPLRKFSFGDMKPALSIRPQKPRANFDNIFPVLCSKCTNSSLDAIVRGA